MTLMFYLWTDIIVEYNQDAIYNVNFFAIN